MLTSKDPARRSGLRLLAISRLKDRDSTVGRVAKASSTRKDYATDSAAGRGGTLRLPSPLPFYKRSR
jgi:hypothetical protein